MRLLPATRFALLAAASLLLAAGPVAAADVPRTDPARIAGMIDAAVQQRLDDEKIEVSPLADDAEFLRRVSLDIAGVIPNVERTVAFLDSSDPHKRTKLIDELLDRPEYTRHMTDVWKSLLIPNTAASARRRHEPMVEWLTAAFAANKPWNQFAREVLTANGQQEDNGAVTFFITHESVDQITDRVAKVFLGVQIQCAQCHDHPFTDWKQDEYWALAAFFTRAKSAYTRTNGKEQYGLTEMPKDPKARALLIVPPSAKSLPPAFLRGAKPSVSSDTPYLPVLADWIAAKDNPYLARAAVNRTWQQMFGRGFVEPVDDMRDGNEPSHPELLKALAREFADSGFDLKSLIRGIANSKAYQRTSKPTGNNAEDRTLISHGTVRVMSPHQMSDSLDVVYEIGEGKADPNSRTRANDRQRFASFFAGEEDATPVEYQAGIPQALFLMNSKYHYRLAKTSNTIVSLKGNEPRTIIETCFLAALSRRPSEHELKIATAHFAKSPDRKPSANDLLWALLNSTEFASNH